MADLDVNLTNWIEGISAVAESGASVTQQVLETPDDPTIFFLKSGEDYQDDSITHDKIRTKYDMEVYSQSISTCRTLSEAIKTAADALASWSASFEGVVAHAAVQDHSDQYQRRLPYSADVDHVGNLLLELYH